MRRLTLVVLLAGILGLAAGCQQNEEVANLVTLTLQPEICQEGGQVKLTVWVGDAPEKGYQYEFSAPAGIVQGGMNRKVYSNRLEVIYLAPTGLFSGSTTEAYVSISVTVTSLDGRRVMGSDAKTLTVTRSVI